MADNNGTTVDIQHENVLPNAKANSDDHNEGSKSIGDELISFIGKLEKIPQALNRNQDQDFMDSLITANESVAEMITAGKHSESQKVLERLEKFLEMAATRGKKLDRHLIIVILYNTACNYQGLWQLDKCGTYIEAVLYNLMKSVKEDEAAFLTLRDANLSNQGSFLEMNSEFALTQAKLLKKYAFLVNTLLQYCAVLSQLSEHEAALNNAHRVNEYLKKLFCLLFEIAKEMKNSRIFSIDTQNTIQRGGSQTNAAAPSSPSRRGLGGSYSNLASTSGKMGQNVNNTSKKSNIVLRDEVFFGKVILEYAYPILESIVATTIDFQPDKHGDILNEAKKSLYNWKTNPENNEKYVRKEFKPMDNEWIQENRTIIGVSQQKDWLSNLNIGTIMHMNPLSYHDFITTSENILNLSKDYLLEKIIYQAIAFFTISTEMRFMETASNSTSNNNNNANGLTKSASTTKISGLSGNQANGASTHRSGVTNAGTQGRSRKNENLSSLKPSEVFHLKAIELACKYITCPCPLINHLISSFQKHYNQNLETIPEESFSVLSSKPTSPRDHQNTVSVTEQNQPNLFTNEHKYSNLVSNNIFQTAANDGEHLQSTSSDLRGQFKKPAIPVRNQSNTENGEQNRQPFPKAIPAQHRTLPATRYANQNWNNNTSVNNNNNNNSSRNGGGEIRPQSSMNLVQRSNNYEEWLEIIDVLNRKEKEKRKSSIEKKQGNTNMSQAMSTFLNPHNGNLNSSGAGNISGRKGIAAHVNTNKEPRPVSTGLKYGGNNHMSYNGGLHTEGNDMISSIENVKPSDGFAIFSSYDNRAPSNRSAKNLLVKKTPPKQPPKRFMTSSRANQTNHGNDGRPETHRVQSSYNNIRVNQTTMQAFFQEHSMGGGYHNNSSQSTISPLTKSSSTKNMTGLNFHKLAKQKSEIQFLSPRELI